MLNNKQKAALTPTTLTHRTELTAKYGEKVGETIFDTTLVARLLSHLEALARPESKEIARELEKRIFEHLYFSAFERTEKMTPREFATALAECSDRITRDMCIRDGETP